MQEWTSTEHIFICLESLFVRTTDSLTNDENTYYCVFIDMVMSVEFSKLLFIYNIWFTIQGQIHKGWQFFVVLVVFFVFPPLQKNFEATWFNVGANAFQLDVSHSEVSPMSRIITSVKYSLLRVQCLPAALKMVVRSRVYLPKPYFKFKTIMQATFKGCCSSSNGC